MPTESTLDPAGEVARALQHAIEEAIPGARVAVAAGEPGHFEVRVVAEAFRERSRVEQHQLVYGAIRELLRGAAAPVHAIDRLETRCP